MGNWGPPPPPRIGVGESLLTGINVINPEADVHETFPTPLANTCRQPQPYEFEAAKSVCVHNPFETSHLLSLIKPSFLSPFRWKNWEKFSKNFTRLRLDSTDLNTTIGVDCKSEGNSSDEIAGGEKELSPSRIRGRPGEAVEPIGLAFGSNRKLPATN